MTGPEPGGPDLASDVELDLLLLTARAGARAALDAVLDIPAGLADIRAGPPTAPDEPDTS